MVTVIFAADLMCDFSNRVLASNLDMDPYGPPRKRPRPESGPLNGSNGTNSGHGGGDDCKSPVLPCSHCSGHCGAHA